MQVITMDGGVLQLIEEIDNKYFQYFNFLNINNNL